MIIGTNMLTSRVLLTLLVLSAPAYAQESADCKTFLQLVDLAPTGFDPVFTVKRERLARTSAAIFGGECSFSFRTDTLNCDIAKNSSFAPLVSEHSRVVSGVLACLQGRQFKKGLSYKKPEILRDEIAVDTSSDAFDTEVVIDTRCHELISDIPRYCETTVSISKS